MLDNASKSDNTKTSIGVYKTLVHFVFTLFPASRWLTRSDKPRRGNLLTMHPKSKSPRSSRQRSGILKPDSGTSPIRFNQPEVVAMIEEAAVDNASAERGTREHFVVMLNHAERLFRAKTDLEMSPQQFDAFARQIRVNRSDAHELWKLHAHRATALAWADAQIQLARDKTATVPALTWQRFRQAVMPRDQPTEAGAGAGADDGSKVLNVAAAETGETDALREKNAALQDALEIAKQSVRESRARAEEYAEMLTVAKRERDEARAEVERLQAALAERHTATATASTSHVTRSKPLSRNMVLALEAIPPGNAHTAHEVFVALNAEPLHQTGMLGNPSGVGIILSRLGGRGLLRRTPDSKWERPSQ